MTNPIYVAPSSDKFHLRADCHRLAVARSYEVIDLDDRGRRFPCKICVPYAPRVKILKRFCPQCNTGRAAPCPHNGGVLIEQICTTTYYSALREPGDTFIKKRYVWPDRAHLYAPAQP